MLLLFLCSADLENINVGALESLESPLNMPSSMFQTTDISEESRSFPPEFIEKDPVLNQYADNLAEHNRQIQSPEHLDDDAVLKIFNQAKRNMIEYALFKRLFTENRIDLLDCLIYQLKKRYRFCISIIQHLRSCQNFSDLMCALKERADTFLEFAPEELCDWSEVLNTFYEKILTIPEDSKKHQIFEQVFDSPNLIFRLKDHHLIQKMFRFMLDHEICGRLDEYIITFHAYLTPELIEKAQALIDQRSY